MLTSFSGVRDQAAEDKPGCSYLENSFETNHPEKKLDENGELEPLEVTGKVDTKT